MVIDNVGIDAGDDVLAVLNGVVVVLAITGASGDVGREPSE